MKEFIFLCFLVVSINTSVTYGQQSQEVVGKWTIVDQYSGDYYYDEMIGITVDLQKNGEAIVVVNIDIPSIGYVDKVKGNWILQDDMIIIDGKMKDTTIKLTYLIQSVEANKVKGVMKADLPILPGNGITIEFEPEKK